MQPLHLHPNMQVRHQAQGLWLRPVVQVRPALRLRELTVLRRSACWVTINLVARSSAPPSRPNLLRPASERDMTNPLDFKR